MLRQEFSDITALLDYLKPVMTFEHGSWAMSSSSWGGTADFPEAVEKLETGWTEQSADISLTADKIKAKIDLTNPSYHWDVTGDFFDVATMLTGEPDHWQQPSYQDSQRKVITIVSNLFFSASTPDHQIKNRGAALIALIDSLQQDPSNIVEVKLVLSVINKAKGRQAQEMWLDMGSSPLDMDAVSFALVSPAMCRRIGFAWLDVANKTRDSKGYGIHKKPDCSHLDNPQLFDTWGTVNGMDVFNTIESSAAWVEQQLERITNERN